MAIDCNKLAKELLEEIGGKDNVVNVVHCATRLRFSLKDESKANEDKINKIKGVVTVVKKAGQFQVVIGNAVPEVYKEVMKEGSFHEMTGGSSAKGNIFNRLIDTIAGIFPPILGTMCGAGLIKGLLAICSAAGWLSPEMGTYIVLNAIGDSVFYFLPVLLGFSAGRKFGCNPYLTALIGASLIYPDIAALGGLTGTTITFLKIPMTIMNYSSSVIPILVAAYACSKMETFLHTKLPGAIKNFVVPMLCLLVIVPLTLFIIGPICLAFSSALANGYSAIPGVIGGILVGALWQVLVIFGMHWGFIPVMMNNIAKTKSDALGATAQVAAMSQTGAAFGISLKMKNKEIRSMTLSTVVSGVFGITEPIIYGITLPRKKPFIMGVIGGAAGGAVAGVMGAKAFAMGAFGILALPSFIDPVNGITRAFWGSALGMVVSFVVAAALSYLTYTDDTMEEIATETKPVSDNKPKQVCSPLNGEVVPLSQSKDSVHAQETLGKGALVIPSEGKVFAPFNGTAAMVYDTKHALGLISEDGVELLIHVGIDTVKLDGKYFTAHVKQDDKITKGQLLLEFDMEKLKAEGFELETPIIITNTPDYKSVTLVATSKIKNGAKLIEIL